MDSYRAIENLIYRYAQRIDLGDFEGVAELFRDAVILAPAVGARSEGYAEILKLYQDSTRLYEEGTPRTKHITTNVIIEVDENNSSATADSYFTVIQGMQNFPLQPIIAGRYHDTFVRRDGQWQFASREMHPELFGDLSQHLLFDAGSIDTKA